MVSYNEFEDFFDRLKNTLEPEFRIIFKNTDSKYMIIKYKDYITFQRCEFRDRSDEIKFKDLNELYNTRTIDEILLKEEWDNIDDIVIDEIYSVVEDWSELKKKYLL